MSQQLDFDEAWFIQLKKADIATLDGWQQFVADRNAYTPPPVFSRVDYQTLPTRDRGRYDLARRMANINLPQHETTRTARVRADIEPTLHANAFSIDPGPRTGVFISADGGLGKSTLVREIAADFDVEVRALQDLAPGLFPHNDRWVPVAWVTVPPKLSMRSLALAILNFYGAPHRKSDSDSALTQRVEDTLRDCGTRLLVLDDITRYKDNDPDRYAADWIRNLMETSVSMIAMGVDVQGSGILYDGKTNREQRLRTQTARRYTVLTMDAFAYDEPADIRAWVRHLRALEDDLYLLDKTSGMLSDNLADYLWHHTQGVIGVLQKWVSVTAMKAVGRADTHGGEFLTQDDFDKTPVPSIASLKNDVDPLSPPPTPATKRTSTKRTTARGATPNRRRNRMYDQPPTKRGGDAA